MAALRLSPHVPERVLSLHTCYSMGMMISGQQFKVEQLFHCSPISWFVVSVTCNTALPAVTLSVEGFT